MPHFELRSIVPLRLTRRCERVLGFIFTTGKKQSTIARASQTVSLPTLREIAQSAEPLFWKLRAKTEEGWPPPS